jgi:rhodanese-related sulfurtransferase
MGLPDQEDVMPTAVDRDEVRRLVDQGAQLVEVLPSKEYHEYHLPGARNIPLRRIERAREELDPNRPVVVYCFDGT